MPGPNLSRDGTGGPPPTGDPVTRVDRLRSPDSSRPAPLTGPLRAGRYRLLHVLGEGGMSVVYAAWDTLLERPVAIKELRFEVAASAAAIEREARVLAAIHHKAVVTIHALHTDDGPPFLVMEWIDGTTLDRLLREAPPTLATALDILRRTAGGLDSVHAAGLVHGDVKPSNVLIDAEGEVKVADVGLVPFLERMESGEILGTPSYMPPERALGIVPAPDLAARSDVYSFAVMCFEVLSGRLPFASRAAADLLRAHANEPPPRISEISDLSTAFDEPLAQSMSKDPTRRHMSCGSLVAALDRARLGTDARGRALRVLVVDDDPDVLESMSETLATRLRGAVVAAAPDGAAALESIEEATPDFVLLDLAMPGLSGIELLAEIRRRAPSAAVFIVTGHGSGDQWSAARALGARRFLIKPIDMDEIVRAIRDLVAAPTSSPRRA